MCPMSAAPMPLIVRPRRPAGMMCCRRAPYAWSALGRCGNIAFAIRPGRTSRNGVVSLRKPQRIAPLRPSLRRGADAADRQAEEAGVHDGPEEGPVVLVGLGRCGNLAFAIRPGRTSRNGVVSLRKPQRIAK